MLRHQVRCPDQCVEARSLVDGNKTPSPPGIGRRGCHSSAGQFAALNNPECLKLGGMFLVPFSLPQGVGTPCLCLCLCQGGKAVLGLAFCHRPSCGWDSGLLLMNGSGGWRIVTFPVVHFQELPSLSSLKSFISFILFLTSTGRKWHLELAVCTSAA